MNRRKRNLPTKEEVLRAVTSDKPSKEFKQYVLIVEYQKISSRLGIITAELIQNNSVVLRLKLTQFPETQQDSFNWDNLRVGEAYFDGYLLDYKEDSLAQLVQQGLKNSIRNGRIPFIPK